MSTILPSTRRTSQWLVRLFETDYCLGLEPYLIWLRQPVGWFALATVASLIVGVFLAPIGLSLAAGLASLLCIGLAYPWLAVKLASCSVVTNWPEIEEDETQPLEIQIRNRCPWPLWGLVIEQLALPEARPTALDDEDAFKAGVALNQVSACSQATFRLSLQPRWRGHYPVTQTRLTCSFPFGLWTASRSIVDVQSFIVRPRRMRLLGMPEQSGSIPHHCGSGNRSGGSGDALGMRDYRPGDSIRHIHWAHTARLDKLVVVERGAAQQSKWCIDLRTTLSHSTLPHRQNLAWRVRIAASVVTLLQQLSVPYELQIEHESAWQMHSSLSLQARSARPTLASSLDRLTEVPLDGHVMKPPTTGTSPSLSGSCSVCLVINSVSASTNDVVFDRQDLVLLTLMRHGNHRLLDDASNATIDLNGDVAAQLNAWLQRIGHGSLAA